MAYQHDCTRLTVVGGVQITSNVTAPLLEYQSCQSVYCL